MDIKIAWRRRTLLQPGETTDVDGYAMYEFNFTSGENVKELVKAQTGACGWQERLFETPVVMSQVEVWVTKDGKRAYVYARPDKVAKG